MLDGVPLQQLAPPLEPLQQEDREQPQHGALDDVPEELQPLMKQRREELTLDGIRLADLGATEVDVSEEIDFVILNALQLTPEHLEAVDVDWLPAQEENHILDQEGELFIGLAAPQLKDTVVAVTTRADSRAAVQRPPIDESRFKVIPREIRRAAAARITVFVIAGGTPGFERLRGVANNRTTRAVEAATG